MPVYLLDTLGLSYRNREILNARDKYIAERFTQIVNETRGGIRARCLLLWGAAHFQGPKRGGYREKKWYGNDGKCLADWLKLDYVVFDSGSKNPGGSAT